jgi:hypothetical protein
MDASEWHARLARLSESLSLSLFTMPMGSRGSRAPTVEGGHCFRKVSQGLQGLHTAVLVVLVEELPDVFDNQGVAKELDNLLARVLGHAVPHGLPNVLSFQSG